MRFLVALALLLAGSPAVAADSAVARDLAVPSAPDLRPALVDFARAGRGAGVHRCPVTEAGHDRVGDLLNELCIDVGHFF